MIKRYIRKMVLKYGAKEFMLMVLEFVAKNTKSKEDDKVVADLRSVDAEPQAKNKASKKKQSIFFIP